MRDNLSLKGKFTSLVNVKKPTGDPTCPPDVVNAKRINHLINEKVGSVEISEDEIEDSYDYNELESLWESGGRCL